MCLSPPRREGYYISLQAMSHLTYVVLTHRILIPAFGLGWTTFLVYMLIPYTVPTPQVLSFEYGVLGTL